LVEEHKNEFTIFQRCLSITPRGCGCIHERHVLIILPFLHLSCPQLKVIFKVAAQPCPLSHPVFKPKLSALSMCAQESSLHTYHTENGDRITNITIYSIYYQIMSLQMTKSSTPGSIAVERHHNSIGNRPGAIARLEYHIKVLQIFFSF
jgi:hypothetical protein